MNINSELYKNKNVHYIGHGQLESSPENFSALHVISHELGHVSEFKSEARRLGMDIADVNVHIHYELRNGKLVAVGGETEATYLPKKEKETPNEIEDIFLSSIKSILDNPNNKLSEKKDKIQSKLEEVQNDMKEISIQNFLREDDFYSFADIKNSRRNEHLIEVKNKLELELEALKYEELIISMKDEIAEIITMQEDFSLNLFKIGAASNLGQNLDLLI